MERGWNCILSKSGCGLWMATLVYLEPECTESTNTSKPSNSPYFKSHQWKRSRVTSNRKSLIIPKTRHLYRHWNCWQKLRLSRTNISEVSEVLMETNSPKPVPWPAVDSRIPTLQVLSLSQKWISQYLCNFTSEWTRISWRQMEGCGQIEHIIPDPSN